MNAVVALTGSCWTAAAAHALYILGLPPRPATAVALAVVAAVAYLQRRRAKASGVSTQSVETAPVVLAQNRAGAILAFVASAALLAVPALEAATVAPIANDAVHIWMPKAATAADGDRPSLVDDRTDGAHPEYPRGLAVATSLLLGPADDRDFRPVRLWTVLFSFLALLVVYRTVAEHAGVVAGLLALLAVGAPAEFGRQAGSGYADLSVAAALLLVTTGSPRDVALRIRPWTALGGAAAAAAFKDEGLIVAAATLCFVLPSAFRRRAPGAFPAAFALFACTIPWCMVRSATPSRALWLVPGFFANPGQLLSRLESTVAELLHIAFGRSDPSPAGPVFGSPAPGGDAVWTVLAAALAILAIRKRGPLDPRPAAVLLFASFAALVVTPEPLDWHVATAAPRLALQALPALVACAAAALFVPPRSSGPVSLDP